MQVATASDYSLCNLTGLEATKTPAARGFCSRILLLFQYVLQRRYSKLYFSSAWGLQLITGLRRPIHDDGH